MKRIINILENLILQKVSITWYEEKEDKCNPRKARDLITLTGVLEKHDIENQDVEHVILTENQVIFNLRRK